MILLDHENRIGGSFVQWLFEFHLSLITVDGGLLSTLVPDKCSLWNRILDQSERNVQDLSRNISSHRNDALVVEGRNICSRPFQINAALILKCWKLEGWVLFCVIDVGMLLLPLVDFVCFFQTSRIQEVVPRTQTLFVTVASASSLT